MKTIMAVRFTMWADILPKLVSAETGQNQPTTGSGKYVPTSDPDSGEVLMTWQPDTSGGTDPTVVPAQQTVRCYARGYTNLGFRSSGNRETYLKGDYTEIESIQFDYPKDYVLNRQSLVTNIRTQEEDSGSDYVWIDGTTGKPVVWEVQGVTPVVDPFGALLRYTTVLKRAEIQ